MTKIRTSSDKATFTASLVDCPLTKSAVFASSFSLGSLALRARFDRAFLGFLKPDEDEQYQNGNMSSLHCQLHYCLFSRVQRSSHFSLPLLRVRYLKFLGKRLVSIKMKRLLTILYTGVW